MNGKARKPNADELLDNLEQRIRALDPLEGEIIFWLAEDTGAIVVDFANEQVQLEAPTLRELLAALMHERFQTGSD